MKIKKPLIKDGKAQIWGLEFHYVICHPQDPIFQNMANGKMESLTPNF